MWLRVLERHTLQQFIASMGIHRLFHIFICMVTYICLEIQRLIIICLHEVCNCQLLANRYFNQLILADSRLMFFFSFRRDEMIEQHC